MDELRTSLKELVESNTFITSIMPAAFLLLLICPVVDVVISLAGIKFLASIRSVLYILYLFGLILCFAESVDWAIRSAFALETLRYLIYIIQDPSFNRFVYLIFYGFLAFYFLRNILFGGQARRIKQQDGRSFQYQPDQTSAPKSAFCGHCGSPMGDSLICPECGKMQVGTTQSSDQQRVRIPGKFERADDEDVSARKKRIVRDNSPVGAVWSFGGGIIFCAFTILLTVYIVLNISGSFSILNAVSSVPIIIICIGCWGAFINCCGRRFNVTGFKLIGGGLLLIEIVMDILVALGIVLGVLMILRGGSQQSILTGVVTIVGSIIAILLVTLYWHGLRRAVVTAREILCGRAVEWRTSLYSIIVSCIGIISMFATFIASTSIQRYVNSAINALYQQYTDVFSSMNISINTISQAVSSVYSGIGGTGVASILGVVIMIYSVVMLIFVRRRNASIVR